MVAVKVLLSNETRINFSICSESFDKLRANGFNILRTLPFDKALLSEIEGIKANGLNDYQDGA